MSSPDQPEHYLELYRRLAEKYAASSAHLHAGADDFQIGTVEFDLLKLPILVKYQFREALQSPFGRRLPPLGSIRSLFPAAGASWNGEIEVPGIGQLAASVDYSAEIVAIILENSATEVAIHSGNSLVLVSPTIDFLAKLPAEKRSRTRLNLYARKGKSPSDNLRQIITYARQAGLTAGDIARFRIGWEHNGPLWIESCQNGQAGQVGQTGVDTLREYIHNLAEIYTIAKENGFERISMPETRGFLQPWQAYFYTRANLELMDSISYQPKYLELHFHNDCHKAEANYLAALQAIEEHNLQTGAQVGAIIDFSFNGLGERNGINGISPQLAEKIGITSPALDSFKTWERKAFALDDNLTEKEALLTTTAGTHADLYVDELLSTDEFAGQSWEQLVAELNENPQTAGRVRSLLYDIMLGSYLQSQALCGYIQDQANGDGPGAGQLSPSIKLYHGSGYKSCQLYSLLNGQIVPSVGEAKAIAKSLKADALRLIYID